MDDNPTALLSYLQTCCNYKRKINRNYYKGKKTEAVGRTFMKIMK